jgi:hypothetical protein
MNVPLRKRPTTLNINMPVSVTPPLATPTKRPTVNVNGGVKPLRVPVLTNNTSPYSILSTNTWNNSNSTSNTYSPVESVPLNRFTPNFKPEVPKSMRGWMTPNRPTQVPWGKPGFLPSNAPPRRRTRRTRRNKKRQTRRRR